MIRIGVHTSVRQSYANALDQAKDLGCTTLQIFSHAPHRPDQKPTLEEANAFHAKRMAMDLKPLVVHTPFLPNLSTHHPRVYERSRRALCEDLDICQALQADYLVIHPGAYSDGKTVKDGIDRMADGLKEALATSSGTMVLIENMAGG